MMLKAGLVFCLLVAAATCQGDNLAVLATKLGLSDLVKLVTAAGLADTLANKGPFTVFAPTNEAFKRLPEPVIHHLMNNKTDLINLLTYHLVPGTVKSTDLKNELLAPSVFANHNVRINIYDGEQGGKIITADGCRVVLADQLASNGVIHEIDRVMFPIPEGTVTDLVAKDKAFSTLLAAVTKAKLAATLAGAGPFTVFAPTNEAFAKLPAGALDKLLANVTALTDVLTYHVVSGTVYSDGLKKEQDVPTLEGKNLHITKQRERVMINNARVELADVSVTNGVIHVIDNVLLPPSFH